MIKDLNPRIVEQWERIKVLIASTEDDVLKNARENVSAGVRARKGLRAIKNEAAALVRLSTKLSKAVKDSR